MTNKKIITITYLIYIAFYQTLVIGGCGYVTFILKYPQWYWALAVIISSMACKPFDWNKAFKDTHMQ